MKIDLFVNLIFLSVQKQNFQYCKIGLFENTEIKQYYLTVVACF